MHPAIIIGTVRSLIVDVAMGQIPRSTERISSLNKLLFWKKLTVFDNPTVRWLATRRKDNMYALACDLMVTPRGEVKDRVWQCFERSILAVICINL